jgi:lysozyme
MNLDKLREELAEDEGCKYEIYLDHIGLETFGIGHLVTIDDPEFGKPVGSPVTQERVQSVFRRDIAITMEDCNRMYDNFDDLPEEAQLVLANMMFNLGYSRMSKFKKLRAAVEMRDWNECAAQMEDSKWYTQVPNRARRLISRMQDLAEQD